MRPGSEVVVAIVVRDPSGANYSPYTFPNPSLAQVGISQPLNKPVLDHIDVIGGSVTGYKVPGAADYSGQWPNTWISNPDLATVPAGAKNTSARVLRTFGQGTWHTVPGDKQYKTMVFRLRGVNQSQYLRLRGTNLPAAVPFETDADGNPLADLWTNATAINPTLPGGADGTPANANLRIPCTTVGHQRSRHRDDVHRHRRSMAVRRTCRWSTVRSTRPTTWRPGRTCGSTAIRSSSKCKGSSLVAGVK